MVLGDSFAWGFGVNDGEIFTDYLESSLSDMEVINLGVTAYGLRQEIDYFKRLGIKFAPDVVVLALVMNDIHDARDRDKGERPKTAKVLKSVPDRNFFRTVKQAFAGNSALYVLLQDVTYQYKFVVDIMVRIGLKEPPLGFDGLDSNLMPALRTYPAKLEKAWKNAQTQLLELKAICERYGIRFIIALVPSRQSIDMRAFQQTIAYTKFYEDDFDLDKPYRALMAFGGKHDIEVVNPVDAFRDAAAAGADLYLTREMHFSKDGHRLFAAQISNYLRQDSRGRD